MPFKSEAQRKYLHMLADQGKIAPMKVHEFEEKTKGKKLPEHVHTPKLGKYMKKGK